MPRRRSEGTRHPWLRADGRYEARYTDARGKRRSVYATTEDECLRRLRAALNLRDEGVVPEGQTIGAWIDRWDSRLDRSGLAPNTIGTYRYHLTLLPDWLRRLPLRELTPELVDDALDEIATRRTSRGTPHAPATVAKVRRLLIQVLAQAVRYGKLARNVAEQTDPIVIPDVEVVPLSVDEAAALREAAAGHRLYSLLTVGFGIGLRLSESIGSRWVDVDLDTGTLAVRKQWARTAHAYLVPDAPAREERDPKSATSKRVIALPARMLDDLRDHRAAQHRERLALGPAWSDSGRVWTNQAGGVLDHDTVGQLVGRWAKQAGIRHVWPHLLRHSAGTLMLASGIGERAIMDILGHADLGMIRRYQHMTDTVRRDAASKLGAALDQIEEARVVKRVVNSPDGDGGNVRRMPNEDV